MIQESEIATKFYKKMLNYSQILYILLLISALKRNFPSCLKKADITLIYKKG